MQAKDNLRQTLIAVFNVKDSGGDAAEVLATAITEALCAFAEVIRGPAPEIVGVELTTNDSLANTMRELTNELREHRRSLIRSIS